MRRWISMPAKPSMSVQIVVQHAVERLLGAERVALILEQARR